MGGRLSELLVIALVVSTTAFGCSRRSDGPVVYPVKGSIRVDGKSVELVAISLVPVDSSDDRRPAGGFTDESGEFNFKAEAGEYWVSISWMKLLNPKASEPEYGPEMLPAKYQNPATSGLKELRVTVEEGDNELPTFELNSKR